MKVLWSNNNERQIIERDEKLQLGLHIVTCEDKQSLRNTNFVFQVCFFLFLFRFLKVSYILIVCTQINNGASSHNIFYFKILNNSQNEVVSRKYDFNLIWKYQNLFTSFQHWI